MVPPPEVEITWFCSITAWLGPVGTPPSTRELSKRWMGWMVTCPAPYCCSRALISPVTSVSSHLEQSSEVGRTVQAVLSPALSAG